jgi:hypothetical protein
VCDLSPRLQYDQKGDETVMTDACAIVRDLLPLYVEGLLSPESVALVEAHLAVCEACRQKREELGTDKAQAEIKKAFSEKIADEFTELMGECPEIDSLEKIPLEVLKNAREENLLNAYLRHKNREDRKILKERESQQKNKAASAGELTAGGEQHDTLLSAFLKGLRY